MMESLVSEPCKAERELCAAILKGVIAAADVQLRAADFSDGLCRDIFTACRSLEAAGKACDLVTVCRCPAGAGERRRRGLRLVGVQPDACQQHADIIRSRALRRDALRCLTDAAGRLSDR